MPRKPKTFVCMYCDLPIQYVFTGRSNPKFVWATVGSHFIYCLKAGRECWHVPKETEAAK